MEQLSRRVAIRAATRSDLGTIRDLAYRIWHQHYPGIITVEQIDYMLDRDYAISTLESDLARGVWMDLIAVDGSAMGFAAYEPTGQPGEVKLHKIYLATELHGQGLGSQLLAHVEATAAARGYARIILQVNKQNRKAIAAYSRNGYDRERELVVDIGGGFVMDDYLMTKELPAAGGQPA